MRITDRAGNAGSSPLKGRSRSSSALSSRSQVASTLIQVPSSPSCSREATSAESEEASRTARLAGDAESGAVGQSALTPTSDIRKTAAKEMDQARVLFTERKDCNCHAR